MMGIILYDHIIFSENDHHSIIKKIALSTGIYPCINFIKNARIYTSRKCNFFDN